MIYPSFSWPRMSCSNRIVRPLQKDQHNRACYFSWQVPHIRSKKLLRTVRFRNKNRGWQKTNQWTVIQKIAHKYLKARFDQGETERMTPNKMQPHFSATWHNAISVRETSLILPRKGQSPSGQPSLLIFLLTQKYTWKYIFLNSF